MRSIWITIMMNTHFLQRTVSFVHFRFARGLVSRRIHASFQQIQDEFKAQMKDWRGATHSSSDFVTHFIAKSSNLTVEEAIYASLPRTNFFADSNDNNTERGEILQRDNHKIIKDIDQEFRFDPSTFSLNDQLSPAQLLAIGSIWFLPAEAPKDPQQGTKPRRMGAKDLTKILKEGDYLRVHHSPRRFPIINQFNWSAYVNDTDSDLPGAIIAQDIEKGYIVVSKPPGAPVHPTVDNVLENVAGAVGRSMLQKDWSKFENMNIPELEDISTTKQRKQKSKQATDPLIYVVTPQRLDQNTSGVFVVATKKIFASYFAKLLRTKTDAQLEANDSKQVHLDGNSALDHVQKRYRCLVCVSPNNAESGDIPTSMWKEVEKLKALVKGNTIVRHFLEPSFKSPRVFSAEYNEEWLECLLKLKKVGCPVPILGNASSSLISKLWGCEENKPEKIIAVVEVEIELLTGRTHQIRGQLSTLGFPICGDVLYGGSKPCKVHDVETSRREGYFDGYMNSELLALQCCELSFLDPQYEMDSRGEEIAIRSERWNTFCLETAWWSNILQEHLKSSNGESFMTDYMDYESLSTARSSVHVTPNINYDSNSTKKSKISVIKTPHIQLSPGSNKYVLVKATLPGKEPQWYVKSATPQECGGKFHGDVARQLVKDLNREGYDTAIMGGGKITLFENRAHIFGFSYGFGKGDHLFVKMLIEKYSPEILASFDDSDGIY